MKDWTQRQFGQNKIKTELSKKNIKKTIQDALRSDQFNKKKTDAIALYIHTHAF